MDEDDDDIIFSKAKIDPNLVLLQAKAVEFVTSVIIKHELELYDLLKQNCPLKMGEILSASNRKIFLMITEITNKFFNDLYASIQHNKQTGAVDLITEMTNLIDYGPHILLDKLVRLTCDTHFDILREELVIENEDAYSKSVLIQINSYLLSKNIIHMLAKGDDEDTAFVNIPEGKKAFDISVNLKV